MKATDDKMTFENNKHFKKRDRKSSSDSSDMPAKACIMSDETKVVNMSGQAAQKMDSKLDKLRIELTATTDHRIKAFKEDMHLELGPVTRKYDELKLTQIIQKVNYQPAAQACRQSQTVENNEVTIIIHNLQDDNNELNAKIAELFEAVGCT